MTKSSEKIPPEGADYQVCCVVVYSEQEIVGLDRRRLSTNLFANIVVYLLTLSKLI